MSSPPSMSALSGGDRPQECDDTLKARLSYRLFGGQDHPASCALSRLSLWLVPWTVPPEQCTGLTMAAKGRYPETLPVLCTCPGPGPGDRDLTPLTD